MDKRDIVTADATDDSGSDDDKGVPRMSSKSSTPIPLVKTGPYFPMSKEHVKSVASSVGVNAQLGALAELANDACKFALVIIQRADETRALFKDTKLQAFHVQNAAAAFIGQHASICNLVDPACGIADPALNIISPFFATKMTSQSTAPYDRPGEFGPRSHKDPDEKSVTSTSSEEERSRRRKIAKKKHLKHHHHHHRHRSASRSPSRSRSRSRSKSPKRHKHKKHLKADASSESSSESARRSTSGDSSSDHSN